jgi:ubiquinone biosynthesis monooxygenase Coq7
VEKKEFDLSLIRPEMRSERFAWRGKGMPVERLKRIKRGLRTLHTLETMAVNIYKFQVRKKGEELDLQLIKAMTNEMTHHQDFQAKLFEYGFRPSKIRVFYWLVGLFFGSFSRLIGERAVLKTGVWVEKKAVAHYEKLLHDVDWDEETREVIEKDQADEFGHISRWKDFLQKLDK